MKTSRRHLRSGRFVVPALAVTAVLALAGCGNHETPAASGGRDKSPLAEYMGEGFVSPAGGIRISRVGNGQPPTEEQLAKQRRVEDATATCMKAAGFDYVAVPPEQNPKGKYDDAFNLPPDKFAQQYGYGISTIDWSKVADDSSNPNTRIRNALSPAAKAAYDKALNGPNTTGNGAVVIHPKDDSSQTTGQQDLGCRGKAMREVYGEAADKAAAARKFDSLLQDVQALRQRIENDPRVVDATKAWSDCMADAGHAGFEKVQDPVQQVQQRLDTLTGHKPPAKDGKSKSLTGPPSFDKVDAVKLADLRRFEIGLAVDDQKCQAKGYDAAYKTVEYAMEKEFVDQHKAELESFRDEMANR